MEEAEARLLPELYESRKSRKHSVILLLSLALNAILLIVTLSVSYESYFEKKKPEWADAIQDAEKAAANLCSGHGNVFVDTMSVNADGSLACECNDCFSGPDCSVVVPNCASNADSGNPLLFEPYWRANPEMGTTVIPGWYRLGYNTRDGDVTGFCTEALEAAIRGMHALAGNAVTEGRYIVIGTGSMQLVNAVIHALALQDAGRVTPVSAKAPYFNLYKGQTEFFSSPLYTFAGEPARITGIPGGPEIEIIASPNNPTGQIQEAPKNVSGPIVYDLAYYWPHLTPMTKPYDQDIMLFTLSKLTGHAGSRLGWVILKDYELYTNVMTYVRKSTIGVSHDTQLRATQLMRAVMGSYSEPGKKNPGGNKKGLFRFGYEVLRSRWARLNAVFQNSDRFSLQTIEPGYCNFFKHVSDPSPGYAWIHCNYKEDANCSAVFDSAGVTGRPGYEFGTGAGTSARFVRLSLLKRDSDFDNLIAHLTVLVDS